MSFTESSLRGRLERLLPRVARPARYMGGEMNSVRKSPDPAGVRIALAFPDIYEVGMSNLGLRILYSVLNARPHLAAERVFAPAPDMEQEMRCAGLPLFSLESSLPVGDFDIVGFSLAYELSYTTVLNLLDLARVPLESSDRTDDHPIVIAGGHCATNPEPMSRFVDAFVIGDGEEAVLEVAEARRERGGRAQTLEALSRISGVYVPALSRPGERPGVRSRVVMDLDEAHFPESLVVPFTETVHDRVAVEVMRGCSRGCRFCQAGMITRPVRERSLGKLCEQARMLLENTGYEEVALTSLSSADYPLIDDLVRALIDRHEREGVGVSLPSLRADAGCVKLAAEIQRVRKTGLTFAPEAGTQRLRNVINKNVTEEDLLGAVEAAVECGWKRVKLYFMIGLPTETDEDLAGIGDLVAKVLGVGRARGVSLALNVTISPFVPKPHTPFQWRPMDPPEELERKIAFVRPLLRARSISLSWHDPRGSRVEAALARGGPEVGEAIRCAWAAGAKLEQDDFNYDRWLAAFADSGLNVADYANRRFSHDEPLPWDFVDVGVSREFLAREDARADEGEATADCRFGACSACGVREALAAMYGSAAVCPPSAPSSSAPTSTVSAASRVETGSPVLFGFRKGMQLRWLGHLDLQRVFERALRMSRVEIAYSQGFNPRPKMSIASALPLGATANADWLTLWLADSSDLTGTTRRLNAKLPQGLLLVSAQRIDPHDRPSPAVSEFVAEVRLEGAGIEDLRAAVAELMARQEIPTQRESSKKGSRRTVDLRPGIAALEARETPEGGAELFMRLLHREFTVRPSEIVTALAQTAPGLEMVSLHRTALLDAQQADEA